MWKIGKIFVTEGEKMHHQSVLLRSLKNIDSHLTQPLSLEKIASDAGYSPYYFSRIFKEYMGSTVMEYVKKRRLIKASEEIAEGGKIIDAAIKYGYDTPGGFAKAFRSEYGFSPSVMKAMVLQVECLGGYKMNHIYLEKQEVHKTVDELHQQLISRLKMYSEEDQKAVEDVYFMASKWYQGKKRYSGDEYFTHPINVAILLSDLEADALTIEAGLLCDVLRKKFVTERELAGCVSAELYKLIQQLTDCKGKSFNLPQDEPVVLVHVAEWLHNMRTIEFVEENQQTQKARETIERIMPLATRLDNKKILAELNELAIQYL